MKPIKRDDNYIFQSDRSYIPAARPLRASLAALQWAADRAGKSYGVFTLGLKHEDEIRIQLEFDEMQRERRLAQRKARLEREEAETSQEDDGLIITDEDV